MSIPLDKQNAETTVVGVDGLQEDTYGSYRGAPNLGVKAGPVTSPQYDAALNQ